MDIQRMVMTLVVSALVFIIARVTVVAVATMIHLLKLYNATVYDSAGNVITGSTTEKPSPAALEVLRLPKDSTQLSVAILVARAEALVAVRKQLALNIGLAVGSLIAGWLLSNLIV